MSEEFRLADVLAPVNEKAVSGKDPNLPYIGLEHLPSGGSRLLGTEPSTASVSTNAVFQRDDVLFGKLRPNLRKALLAPFDGYCSTDILVLRAQNDVYARYAGWLVRSEEVGAQAERTAIGTKMPRTSWPLLKDKKVFVPPYSEQRLIAHILETLDIQIRRTEEIIAKLEQVKQGLLTDLLTRGIDENGELRPSPKEAPELYRDSPLGRIPLCWGLSKVGENFDIQLGKMLDEEKNTGEWKPYLGNKNVQWDFIDTSDISYVRLTKSEQEQYRLKKGDLLVCEGGEVGRAALWDDQISECYYQKALHRLRPRTFFSPELMKYLLQLWTSSGFFGGQVSRTSIAHLTKEKLASLALPVIPQYEQAVIVRALQSHRSREAAERTKLSTLNQVKAGLINDLLTGRVRVTPLLEQAEQAIG